ncbi:MAG: hypothetical protein M1817_004882 [Caeruleum heppii]|nr:MAG: hypothetical protein M1817_004882 [Caeruleum heppii]
MFFPGEEPLPGTWDCRFCGEPLSELRRTGSIAAHVHQCAGQVAVADAQALTRQQDAELSDDSVRVLWCAFCEEWLSPLEDWAQHFSEHEGEAHSLIESTGYVALGRHGRPVRPQFCPFCYHDEELPWHKRLVSHEDAYHVRAHLNKLGEEQRCRCPAFPVFCGAENTMMRDELTTHLKMAHAINPGRDTRRMGSDVGGTKKRRDEGGPTGPKKKKTKRSSDEEGAARSRALAQSIMFARPRNPDTNNRLDKGGECNPIDLD